VAETVLQRIAAGDPSAVEECLEQYSGLVWSLVRGFSGNHADAEDAVQEIFIEIWRHAGRFDAQVASETTFITMLARRRLIDRHRRRSRRRDTAPLDMEPPAASADDEQRLDTLEQAGRARQMLEQLRPEQRHVLELSLGEGLSHREIAEATSLPLGTVKTHSRRGLIRLRELLQPDSARAGAEERPPS